jgi:hypothetical protein
MIENCPEADIQLDARRLSSAAKLRSAECYCSRVTLDELLSDAVMAPVLRSAGYEPDEFREMMTEMPGISSRRPRVVKAGFLY